VSDDARDDRPPRTTAEWWTFAVSLALVAGVVGLVVLSWATGPSGPPVLVARPSGPVVLEGGHYRVPFEVRNDGADAADQVQVVATLEFGGEVVAEGEQSVEFLSGGETEKGAFLFRRDPTRGELTIDVASYAVP